MTVAHVYTVAFQGIEAREVDVQVHIGEGGGGLFNIVGLADKAVAESRERVFDRIDMHVEVAGVSASDLSLPPAAEGSAEVAARVAAARTVQRTRFAGHAVRTNAEAEGELLDKIATPDAAGGKLLTEAAERMKLSARGYHRVLKVARTIADLAGAETVTKSHIAEALSYRRITHLA